MTLTLPSTFIRSATFAIGEPLLYANSVGMLAVAINQKDFAATYHVASGPTWRIEITRAKAESP